MRNIITALFFYLFSISYANGNDIASQQAIQSIANTTGGMIIQLNKDKFTSEKASQIGKMLMPDSNVMLWQAQEVRYPFGVEYKFAVDPSISVLNILINNKARNSIVVLTNPRQTFYQLDKIALDRQDLQSIKIMNPLSGIWKIRIDKANQMDIRITGVSDSYIREEQVQRMYYGHEGYSYTTYTGPLYSGKQENFNVVLKDNRIFNSFIVDLVSIDGRILARKNVKSTIIDYETFNAKDCIPMNHSIVLPPNKRFCVLNQQFFSEKFVIPDVPFRFMIEAIDQFGNPYQRISNHVYVPLIADQIIKINMGTKYSIFY